MTETRQSEELYLPVAAMGIIIAAGTTLRLWGLSTQSLWIDEVSQVNSALAVASQGFGVVAERDNVGPLSHWILWALVTLFGVSESVVRLPSVVAGIITIPLVSRLGRLWFSNRVGLGAAAAVAISPFAVWHAQDGRMYALAMCFSAWALVAFSSALGESQRLRHWVALTAATALGVYTHQFAVLISGACGLFVVFQDGLLGTRTKRWATSQIIAALAFLPWFLHSIDRFAESAGSAKGSVFMWAPYSLFTFLFGYTLGPSVRELHWNSNLAVLSPYIVQVTLAMFVFGLAVVFGMREILRLSNRSSTLLALLCVLTPLSVAMVAPALSGINFNVRYAAVSFPAFIVLFAAAVLAVKSNKIRMVLAGAFLVGTLVSLHGWYFNPLYSKSDFRAAGSYLRTKVASDDLVILSSSTTRRAFAFYGFRPKHRLLVSRRSGLDEVLAQIDDPRWQRVWLIESRSWEGDPRHELRRKLRSSGSLDVERDFVGITAHRYSLERP